MESGKLSKIDFSPNSWSNHDYWFHKKSQYPTLILAILWFLSVRSFDLGFRNKILIKNLEYDSTGLQKDENCEMLEIENAKIQSSILENQVSDLPVDDSCLELGKLYSWASKPAFRYRTVHTKFDCFMI